MSTGVPVTARLRELFTGGTDQRKEQREALNAFRDVLHRELDRSRRYERRFAVVAASLREELSAAQRTALSAAVVGALRSSDVFCIAERRLYLFLPEADADAAERAFERIQEIEPGAVDGLTMAIAAFPDDGVTMGAILALLRQADVARRRRMSRIDGSFGGAPSSATDRKERAG